MFIEGMKSNTAIKIGDKYVVQLPYAASFEINDVEIGNKSQVVVDSIDDIQQVKRTPKKIDHYVDSSGTWYHQEEINKITCKYIDEDGDDCYPTIEDQIEHLESLKWVNNLEKVYTEEKVERLPVEIEVIGSLEDTGSDFIETSIEYGKAHWEHSSGFYKVKLSQIARDEVVKIDGQYKETEVEIPNHSNVEYVKVNGKFVFTRDNKEWIKNTKHVKIVSDLKEAKDMEGSVRNYVRKVMMPYIEPVKIDEIYTKEVIDSLRSVTNQVQDMSLKQSSKGSKFSVLKTVNELIEKLRSIDQ